MTVVFSPCGVPWCSTYLRRNSAAALPGQLRAGDLVVAHSDYWRTALTLVPAFPEDIVGVTSGAPCPDDETTPYRCFPYWQGPDRDGSMLRHMMDGTTASFTVRDELVWEDSRHFLPQGRRDEVVQVGVENTHALAEALAGWVGDHLTAAERPSTFTFGPQLPRQHNGKPADWIIEG